MDDLITWSKEYSLPVLLLISIGGVILFIVKLLLEESLKKYLERKFDELEAKTERRTAFKDTLMSKRFDKVVDIHSKLIKISTEINRHFNGKGTIPIISIVENNLTTIYEELEANRIILSQSNYELLKKFANFLVSMANNKDKNHVSNFKKLNDEIIKKLDKEFDIEKTEW